MPLGGVSAPSDNDLRVLIGMVGSGSLQLIIDVAGYFTAPGTGPLWGRGRPNTFRWGFTVNNLTVLCSDSSGTYRFGLSNIAVEWGNAADACPQGTWVCTSAQRGTDPCDTDRAPNYYCAYKDCAGACGNFAFGPQNGWVADAYDGGPEFGGFVAENGVTGGYFACAQLPVWCCSLD